ncbi:MAG: hypothetical protein II553_05795, partial [Lachnospiraceae bacterium]|nr:hypothetical protein [Lachnospiraceae bacterium]
WVPMNHLLLWNVCPVNENFIYFKAMLCANIDEQLGNNRLGLLFMNPDNMEESSPMSVDFRYYFVMKTEGNMTLLSNQNTMNGLTDQVLYGWVDKNSYVAWDQRSCLEPTWEIEDVEFFSQRGIIANIYDQKRMDAGSKASWITFEKKKSSANFDPHMYRMDGNQLRYPILNDNSSTVWNLSTFSSPGEKGAINVTSEEQKKAIQKPRQLMENLAKINIAIVIDGTRSMEPYFPAIRDAIKEITSYLSNNMKTKVGVLIYRDKADGQYVSEMVPLTNPDNQKLAEWLSKGGTYGIKSGGGDKTYEEALFYGIHLGAMLIAVLLWFRCDRLLVPEENRFYLFGGIAPKLALLITTVLRFVPLLRRRAGEMRAAQTAVGVYDDPDWIHRTKSSMTTMSALTTWSLEHAIDAGAAMKARGYGLPGRTTYRTCRFRAMDGVCITVILALTAVTVVALATGRLDISYYPNIITAPADTLSRCGVTAYAVLCLLPFLTSVKEAIRWSFYRSKM